MIRPTDYAGPTTSVDPRLGLDFRRDGVRYTVIRVSRDHVVTVWDHRTRIAVRFPSTAAFDLWRQA